MPPVHQAHARSPDVHTPLLPKPPPSPPTKAKPAHYRNVSGPRFKYLFTSIILGNTIAFFDSTLMASSHPVITSYFDASNSASWLSTVFYLTSTVSQPLYGRTSDTLGRRPVYLFASVLFLLSTAWCALAGSIGSFIAARAVCGIGAGGVMSVANVILSDVVKIEYRGIYQSYYNLSYGIGNGLGASLGGLMVDKLGWRWAFGVQVPFIALFIVASYFSTPTGLGPDLAKTKGKGVKEAFETFDFRGAITLTMTITCLILGINLGGNILTWTHPLVLTSLALSAITAAALPSISRRATRPMLPLPLLASAPTANLMWSSFFFSLANNAVLFNVPLYLQAVRQTSPTTSGLYLTSPLVGVGASAIIAGYFITYTRRFTPMLYAGALSLLAGTIATTLLSPTQPLWTTVLMIPWASIGQGLYFPTVTIATLAVNAIDDQAVVVTTLGLLRSLGSILGVAVSSWVFQNSLAVYLEKEVQASPHVKRRAIQEVRRSVGAIRTLEPGLKQMVIRAYAESLRWTFAQGILWAVVVGVLTVIIKLPRLQKQSEKDREEEDGEEGERARRGFRRSNSNRSRRSGISGDGVDEEALLAEDDEETLTETGSEDVESYDGDVERERLERVRSHSEALQLGRRASHDTTL
jgi:MFS family permease